MPWNKSAQATAFSPPHVVYRAAMIPITQTARVSGMSKIVVYDNGDGFSRSDARALFGNLGGSWKRHVRQTKRNHRMIHSRR